MSQACIPIITGVGLVTPLGSTADETWSALIDGGHIRDHARLRTDERGRSRACAIAISAARQAVRGLPQTDALVVGTSKGSVENWTSQHLAAPLAGRDGTFGLSDIASEIAREFGIGGPRLTLSAACASGLHALIRGAMMIQAGQASRVLVVAAEASVHPLFVGSFKRLGVLPPEGHGCRPFDEARAGFLMSEAAAAVCLAPSPLEGEGGGEGYVNKDEGRRMKDESQAAPVHPSSFCLHPSTPTPHPNPLPQGERRPSARIAIERFAMGGDATHLTGGDPQARTLRYLLGRVVDDRPVDLVHAHATGTKLNDPTELAAIEAAVCASSPNIYSHKGALGHSLGAAGLVSIVLNCMMHQRGIVLPNIQTRNPTASRLSIAREPVHRRITRSLAIATGFGGPTAVVSLVSA